MKLGEIYDIIDEFAPFSSAESFDNPGILIGGRNKEIERILMALDCSLSVAKEAARLGADLVLTHHPIIFRPLSAVSLESPVAELIKSDIAVLSAHTNIDKCAVGTSMNMAHLLGLECISQSGFLAAGDLGTTPDGLISAAKAAFGTEKIRYAAGSRPIRKVAVCAGSGGDMLEDAIILGADALVTGDVKHSQFILANNLGFTLIDAGHYETEKIYMEKFKDLIADKISAEIILSGEESRPYKIG